MIHFLLNKTVKSALISIAGVGLTYLSQYISGLDFGQFGPVVVGILSVLANTVKELPRAINEQPSE